MKLHQQFLWTMIASLAIAAMLGIWAVLSPNFGPLQGKVLITSLLIGTYALPAFGCAIILHRGLLRPAMWTGIIAAGIALGVWLLLIWVDPSFGNTFWSRMVKFAITATIVSVWATHLGLMLLGRLVHPGARFVRAATLVVTALLGVTSIFAMWAEFEAEVIIRGIAVLAILGSCGTLITPVLLVIELLKARNSRESIPARIMIDLTCPRCGSREQIAAGTGRCSACGLRIDITVEEPRCTCGYLLHRLTGEHCPECGRTIPASDRWRACDSGVPVAAP